MTRSNRDRIELLPREGSNLARMKWSNLTAMLERHPGWEPLAVISCGGLLVRHRETQRLAEFVGDRIMSVPERKALAALDELASSSAG